MSEAARPSPGRLFPQVHGVIARQDDRYMMLSGSGARATIEGSLCAEVDASLAQGAATPMLLRLAPAHPSLQELTDWLATPSVPLTALDVVRLDGFDTFFLELLGLCNERCVHCYADAAPTVTDALDRATALSVIEQAHALGFRRIQLTGGDPLLSDYLPEAVRHAREVGIEHVEIYTNGLALTEELLAKLAPARPAFAFSIYSADPDEHDRITRTPGSHRRTLSAIERVVARALPVRCSVIVVDHATDVPALTTLLAARGVSELSVSRTFSVGRGVDHALASQELPLAAGPSTGGGHRATSAHSDGKLCVTYTGDVVPCIFQRSSVLGNVRDATLLDLLTSPPRRAEPRGLPVVEEIGRRLQCTSCRVTEIGLALLRGAR